MTYVQVSVTKRDPGIPQRFVPGLVVESREGVPVGVHIDIDRRPRPVQQRHQPRELRQREVRRSEADGRKGRAVRHGREIADDTPQVVRRQSDHLFGDSFWNASSSVRASGVRPTAWNIARAPEDAATAPSAFRSSSPVFGETDDGRDTLTASPPDHVPDRDAGETCIAPFRGQCGYLDQHAGASVLRAVKTVIGNTAGERAAEVDEIAVAVRARPEHRIREDDRVRLGPGDLGAEPGSEAVW